MNAIIVVAYNRPYETRRLLDTIGKSYIPDNERVDIVLSVDRGPLHEEVYRQCESFEWKHGEYRIIRHPKRMGLRPHILSCGELTSEYDGIVVLEDDLVVSPNFYYFAKAAMEYYDKDDHIAQISLYSYAVNEFISRPFYPEKNNLDVYAMKVTQSWGECWTRRMWEQFMNSPYYKSALLKPRNDLPVNVNKWKESSWKKNFSNYLVDSGRYVIYPYYSFTTNYTIAGEHCKMDVPDYHVVMQTGIKKEYTLGTFDACVKYDQFFERELTAIENGDIFRGKKICMDLYGIKREYGDADVLITTAAKPLRIICTYGLGLKPHEENIIHNNSGNAIYAYDLHIMDKINRIENDYSLIRYDIGCLHWKRTFKHAVHGFCEAIKNRLKIN